MASIAGSLLSSTFELYRIHSGLLEQATSVADCIFNRNLIRQKGHITDREGASYGARHGFTVVDHVTYRYGKGVLVAQHHHAQRISNKDGINPCGIHHGGCTEVIGGQHRDAFAVVLLRLECGGRDFSCSQVQNL